jgi:hypothetical protein
MANLNLSLEQRFSIALTILDAGSEEVVVNVPERGFYRLQRIDDAEMLAFALARRHNGGERRPSKR